MAFKIKKEYTEYEYKSLRLPKALIEQIQKLADENSISFNKVVIQSLEYALNNVEDSDNKKRN